MPYTELLKWVSFFKSRPVGWREDQRTFMLLKAQGAKGSPEEMFPTLKMIKASEETTKVPDKPVVKGMVLQKMLAAKGGDSVNIFDNNGK